MYKVLSKNNTVLHVLSVSFCKATNKFDCEFVEDECLTDAEHDEFVAELQRELELTLIHMQMDELFA